MDKILTAIKHASLISPDKLALHGHDGRYTYAQLREESDKVVCCLFKEGLKTGNKVACLFSPGAKKTITFLGALKAGITFVNISLDLPTSTIQELLKNLNVSAVIGPSELPDYGPKQIFPDRIKNYNKSSCNNTQSNEIAVVTFSSGTTGLPKAIPISRANLISRSKTLDHDYIEFGKNTLHFTQFWAHRILRVFTEGHTLFIYDPKSQGISGIASFLVKYKITLMVSFIALFREIELNDDIVLNDLQAVVMLGERGLPSDIAKFETLTKPHALLMVAYGSNEYLGVSRYIHRHGQAMPHGSIPLGHAFPNDDLRVVKPNGCTASANVKGEIIIVSDVIPTRYLNNPEQSAVAFRTLSHSGEHAYFTGDMGYFDSYGVLHSAGRKDDQVKIRGNLVNILEVEHVLSSFFKTDEMAVSSSVSNNNQNQIACYYVADDHVDKKEITDQLRKYVPNHMIPSYFHKVDKLPRTASGKVIRRELYKIQPETKNRNFSQAITRHEKIVNNVMVEVLGHKDFNRDDDFFDIGGDSLSALTLTLRLEAKFGISLPLEGLFLEGASVELVANRIVNHTRDNNTTSLVSLNYAASDCVFYALPVIEGHLSDYVVLGEAMSTSANLKGIRFNNLFSPIYGKQISIKKLASEAADKILEQNGSGEINLIGFSAAGLFAYETAKMLYKRGHEINTLILIDSNPIVKKQKWPIPLKFFARIVRSVFRRIRRKEDWALHKTYSYLYLQNQFAKQCINPIEINRTMLFVARLGSLTKTEIDLWRRVTTNDLEVVTIAGKHIGLRQMDIAMNIVQNILKK